MYRPWNDPFGKSSVYGDYYRIKMDVMRSNVLNRIIRFTLNALDLLCSITEHRILYLHINIDLSLVFPAGQKTVGCKCSLWRLMQSSMTRHEHGILLRYSSGKALQTSPWATFFLYTSLKQQNKLTTKKKKTKKTAAD